MLGLQAGLVEMSQSVLFGRDLGTQVKPWDHSCEWMADGEYFSSQLPTGTRGCEHS